MHVLVAIALLTGLVRSDPQQGEAACSSWQECRQAALDAAGREDFEAFHSLAWRAVQSGPPNDPALLYMLARAQSLSGRPHDALIMLRRLADRGAALEEVETLEDFRRVRNLPDWPAMLDRIRGTTSATPVTPSPSPPSPPGAGDRGGSAARAVPRAPPPAAVETTGLIPLPSGIGAPIAMAYDEVSRRLVIADGSSDTLKVLSEVSGNAADLVSRGWAGAYHTTALAIDSRRGNLWVVGADTDAARPASVLHRLQLISGRLRYSVAAPDDAGATRFGAVAISGRTVVVLDVEGGRILELQDDARAMRVVMPVSVSGAAGLALAADNVAYLAHAGGVARLDLAAKRHANVRAAKGIALDELQWIGRFENTLLAVQRRPDGSLAAVRLQLDRRGRTVTAVETLGPAASQAAVVMGDVFYYVATLPGGQTAVQRLSLRNRPMPASPGRR